MHNELRNTCKEVFVAYFGVIFWHLLGETKEHTKTRSQNMDDLRTEVRISVLQNTKPECYLVNCI
jgi:hypothetical protein